MLSNTKPNKNGAEADWQKNQALVCRFSTVEQFWRLFNNISSPRELDNVDLCLCHDDLMLAWEHPRFLKGGRWTIRMPEMSKLDLVWTYLALGAIGEQLPGCCGVSVSIRKAYSKATLWLDNEACSSLSSIQAVGRKAANILTRITDDFKVSLEFQLFNDKDETIPAEINKKWSYVVDRGTVSDCKIADDSAALAFIGGRGGNFQKSNKGGRGHRGGQE